MAFDSDMNVPPRAQGPRVQKERLYIAAIGYWAIRECMGDEHPDTIAAEATFKEVARRAFMCMYPQEMNDPENPGNPCPRGIPHDGMTDEWVSKGKYPGGQYGRLLKKLATQIALETAALGG